MTGDSVMNVEVFDAGSNSNNIPLVKLSAMGGQFVSFKELSSQGTPYTHCVDSDERSHRCGFDMEHVHSPRSDLEVKLRLPVVIEA